ncbi:expressed unknown protein [Seminavis robusta]|uniref:SGNH hydrolase-type esterase domain-containing protein n=1 Tax=Seminavis robusta TaxID=568900 RepID=A0A9N8ER58_9STRA|nr:expressed unknown protein [Seminavis robusta]|eukprot:Sro1722_g293560.1 n/a (626) ;mRNA; f:8140-10017
MVTREKKRLIFRWQKVLWMSTLSLQGTNAFLEAGRKPRPRCCPLQSPVALLPLQEKSLVSTIGYPTASSTCLPSLRLSFLEDFAPSTTQLVPIFSFVSTLWKHAQGVFDPLFQPVQGQKLQALSGAVTANLASLTFWKDFTASLQRVGEVSFLTLLFVSLMQGGVAVFQYRTNPSGELMVPPGLTVGEELPLQQLPLKNGTQQLTPTTMASLIRSGAQSNSTTTGTTDTTDNALFARLNAQRQELQALLSVDEEEEGNLQEQSRYARILHRVNRLLVVLVPWIAGHATFILQRNAHLFHIGSILTLTSIFDTPQSFIQGYQKRMVAQTNASSLAKPSQFSLSQGDQEHLVVIGDSLAVGLGSVDKYDKNKNNDLPFYRIENLGNPPEELTTSSSSQQSQGSNQRKKAGPAFPKSLARTLAQRLEKPVKWRSAGVDGGDIENIRKYCLGVIEEEISAGRTPDAVVILCGANDMKYCLSNPLQRYNWPKAFRSKLKKLIEDIQAMAPEVTIILPALPTQTFHKNSPLNVFPLGFLVDSMMGFWDSQKKCVADSFDSIGVQYIGLSPREVGNWYKVSHEPHDNKPSPPRAVTLLAQDGVHPNARCYTNWAQAIGRKVKRQFGKNQVKA